MARNITKEFLSGSTNGKMIGIAATGTPGTVIHVADTQMKDEVYIYATNTAASTKVLTIEFGGVTSADDIVVSIAGQSGLELVLPGLILSNGLEVRMFCPAPHTVNVGGYVERVI